ncbi:transmembrane and immunoglobulin domain-containing protein 2 isoform X2 [Rhinopithecus roxellana]|uniref:transmembrane and immunoglobulin domain-containing protein 2 isoform X2 n=1 Tax=Rhinopithecus roxellana TaxID=61622 RepID=UPI000533586E|nr:transmembrane and immunoglobulin domain-containing protein 2 isoform X2 [Rhinopithecus roxellana]
MGSPGMVLGLLVQFCALQGASSLSVQQGPNFLQVRQGSRATLVCQVDQAPAWERLRVRWTKDGAILCQPYITNGSLSLGVCGPQGQLSWQAPSHLILKLDPVSLNHSGAYVCWAATEIPELEEAEGNVTRLSVDPDDPTQNRNLTPGFPGLLFVLLGAGGVGVALVLGAWFRGRRCCQQRDSGNAFYSNVLYRPRGPPKKTEDRSGEGKDQRGQSIYSTSFPQLATCQPHLAPRPCPSPRPGHPISMVRVFPSPGPTQQPRPRGFPKVGEE